MLKLHESLRVLIVEDLPDELADLEAALASTGLPIKTEAVSDFDSAVSELFSTYYDLVILDLLLHVGHPGESEDAYEGLWIMQEILERSLQGRIPIIISSANTKQNAPLVGRAFKEFKILDAWFKSNIKSYPEDFIEVLTDQKYFGLTCDVIFDGGLDWKGVVTMLGDRFRWASSPISFEDAELELRHILRRLFGAYAQVRFSPLNPGMGGAGVLIAIPIDSGGAEGARMVVKYGGADETKAENDNFEKVKDFMQGGRSTQVRGVSLGLRMGAIAYSFLGSSDGSIKPFDDFYSNAGSDDVKAALTDLFQETCGLWYKKPSRSVLTEKTLEDAYAGYMGFTPSKIKEQFEFRFRERPLGRPIVFSTLSFEHPIDQFLNGAFRFSTDLIGCRTHGDLHPANIFVDRRTHVTWLIDFGRTGIGHWARDFVCLEAALIIRHTPSHPVQRVFEFLDAWLRLSDLNESIKFNDAEYPEMVKAASCISHLRKLANTSIGDSGLSAETLLLQYSSALFFQLLNYTRLHRLIRDSNRKNYVLVGLCLLSKRITALKTLTGVT